MSRLQLLLVVLCFLALGADAQGGKKKALCAGQNGVSACKSAIQIGKKIECYCHAQCLLEQPGPCCEDFEEACPAEFEEGSAELAALEGEEAGDARAESIGPAMGPAIVLPEGCEFPEGNIIPVPSQSFDWEESQRSCDGKCGSSMTKKGEDGKEAVVCFCDSGCLLTGDCCPDFMSVCPIDQCILAMVIPPAPEIGTCKNKCDSIVEANTAHGFCSCEAACVEDGSCCNDFQEMCPDVYDASLVPSLPTEEEGSCYNKCGGGSGECWCDATCLGNGDCCEDYEKMCGAAFSLITWTGHGSCHGKCGGSGFDCWCDEKCLVAGDCCDDYLVKCQTEDDGTCDGACGGYGGGCWCDNECAMHGDCCDDKAEFCSKKKKKQG